MDMKKAVLISSTALIIGILFFFLYNNWLIVSFGFPRLSNTTEKPTITRSEKKTIHIRYQHDNELKDEKKELLWSNNMQANTEHLIRSWLSILDEEEPTEKPCALQDIGFSSYEQELFISFDQSPLINKYPVYTQYLIIKSLLKTIESALIPAKRIRFLVQHRPIDSMYLDFSFPWPINGFCESTHRQDEPPAGLPLKADMPFTVILDPAGDAATTGRIIDTVLERGLTLECAQRLKETLNRTMPQARIFLSRLPGETVGDLQKASFADRLNPDLYLTLTFYREENDRPSIYCYYFTTQAACGHSTEYTELSPLILLPCDKAHLKNSAHSFSFARTLCGALTASLPSYTIKGPVGIPFKPLTGITAPACALEIGFKNKDTWSILTEKIAQAIVGLVNNNSSSITGR